MTEQHNDRVEPSAGRRQAHPGGSPLHLDLDVLQPDASPADQPGTVGCLADALAVGRW
jgi:hypothetical protein